MKINIKATNIELTPAISDYVYKKVNSIDKYLPLQTDTQIDTSDIVAQVEVGKTTQHHKTGEIFKAEIHITGGGLDLYAKSEQEDIYAAIDLVKDELVHITTQLKGKKETLARKGAQVVKNMMKGLSDTTARAGHATARGWSWGVERIKFKGFKSFKKRP